MDSGRLKGGGINSFSRPTRASGVPWIDELFKILSSASGQLTGDLSKRISSRCFFIFTQVSGSSLDPEAPVPVDTIMLFEFSKLFNQIRRRLHSLELLEESMVVLVSSQLSVTEGGIYW